MSGAVGVPEREEGDMRCMLLLKGDPPEGSMPSEELIGAMLAYDEELANAGVLLASEGLHSSSRGGSSTRPASAP
jgi:hypothetical protein